MSQYLSRHILETNRKKSAREHDSEVGALVEITPRHGVQRYRSKLSCFQKQLGLFKKQKQERRRVPTVT